MSIPSLTVLCAQKIANNQTLLTVSIKKNLPKEVLEIILEIIEKESIVSKWKWFVTPLTNESTEFEFNLTPKSYKDFCILCPTYQVKEDEFLLSANQKNQDWQTISKIIEFVKEKGQIKGTAAEIACFTENHERLISLYYRIPTSDRTDLGFFGGNVKIATIKLPYKKRQTVNVCIETLSKINQTVNSTWSQETYNKVRDFVIYYVNQLAIDHSGKNYFSYNSTTTDNRLYLAHNAENENKASEHLFKEYNGPNYWLLHD